MWKSGIVLAASLFILSGCASTVRMVPVSIMHPAEIDMANYKQVVIGEIKGRYAEKFIASLKERLVESGKFKIIDRRQLNQIMGELELSNSTLADPERRKKIGKLFGGAALITGNLDGRYTTELTYEEGTVTVNRQTYPSKMYTYTGKVVTSGSIDVVDIETGEIIKSKVLNAAASAYTQARDTRPADPDQASIVAEAIEANLQRFIRSITTWREVLSMPFQVDEIMPRLQTGVSYVQVGDFPEALKEFSDLLQFAENNPKIERSLVAKIYFNLALTYECMKQFDDGSAMAKKAYMTFPKIEYLEEQSNINTLRRIDEAYRKQQNQK